MKELKNNSNSMIGWVEEMDYGQPMKVMESDCLQLKLIITPEGVMVTALSEIPASAQNILEQMGFLPKQVKKVLCG